MTVAKLHGLKIQRIGISRRGPYLVREAGSPPANLRTTLAGPLSNLLLAFVSCGWLPDFALCNLVLGVFNLLPLAGSDGERALHLLRQA